MLLWAAVMGFAFGGAAEDVAVIAVKPIDGSVAAPVDPDKYQIGPEDLMFIRVWREPDFTLPEAVRPDGKITMPLQKTFWSVRFGMAVDRFGTPWIINCAQAA